MLDLRTKVIVTTVTGTEAGVIVGRSRQEHPHYDVKTDDGIMSNVPASQVKEVGRYLFEFER